MVKKTVTIAGAVAGVVFLSVIGVIISYELTYQYRAYPGLFAAGYKLGGMNKNQIEELLARNAGITSPLKLRWGVNEWSIPPEDLGIRYDWQATAIKVLSTGRDGDRKTQVLTKIKAVSDGFEVKPIVSYDSQKIDRAIASISGQINIPAKEPEIIKTGTIPEILVSKGENGQEVNVHLLRSKIIAIIDQAKPENIDIPVVDIKPELSDEQAERARAEAEKLLGKTLTINFDEDDQSWIIEDEELLTWIDLHTGGWNRVKIDAWVKGLASAVDRPAQDASFRWVGENKVEEFRPAKNGVKTDTSQMVTGIIKALGDLTSSGNDQTVVLTVDHTPPQITNEDVNNLGIKELLGKGESWFTGSITNRIFNLKKAADVLNGRLVAPGETFSFNEAVGEVSADTGYKQAYIIKEGKTILGDGGGVCQVSTTLFRAVLDTGLPIVARTPHAYRVSYYEVSYQVGFDATVFQPAPDFKFSNDTPAFILIQTEYDEAKKYLAFEIYGTSDGRVTEVSKARMWEVVAPPPDLYIDDPNLPVGKIVQTEHAAKGAKVAFDWKVTRGGEVLQERTFFSNYRPWQAVYLRGTKTN